MDPNLTADPPAQLPLHLPNEFWSARPELEHIRTAARARLVSPDAVLGAVLGRVAAITPHTVELPAIVGSPMGLTFFAALAGPPESGKSAAAAVAGELVLAPPTVHDRLPIGSEEGMVEILYEVVDHEENGKKTKVKCQTRHGAIFHIDEGAMLTDLGARSGSTLMATLRTAWSHGTIGNTNASADRRRILDGRSYVYGLTLGIQPELAGPLLGDAGAGTPQRFIWLMATDPAATDAPPLWPGPLCWGPLTGAELDAHLVDRTGWPRHPLAVSPTIVAAVRSDRLDAMRGKSDRQLADAHAILARLKIAALLSLLDHRSTITDDDWSLAGMVSEVSRNVRCHVQSTVALLAQGKELAAVERHSRRELHVEESREARALASATRSIANAVIRHQEGERHKGAECHRNCLTTAMAGSHRKLISVDDAIAQAEQRRWIVATSGRWLPGESRPS